MNKIIAVVLLAVILSGWGIVIYQSNLQRGSEERIAQAVFEQIESRRQMEVSIKQDIEAKKKAQAFITQLDYEKELVASIRQEIADSESRQMQEYQRLEDLFAEDTEAHKQKQQEQEQQLAGYKAKADECNGLLQMNIGHLEEYHAKVLESNRRIAQLEESMVSQSKRITDYEKQLQAAIETLGEYKDKQKEVVE